MVGVDVGQLNVNQEQNLNLKQKIMIRMERSQLNTTYSLTSDTSHLWNESNHDRDYIKKSYLLPPSIFYIIRAANCNCGGAESMILLQRFSSFNSHPVWQTYYQT